MFEIHLEMQPSLAVQIRALVKRRDQLLELIRSGDLTGPVLQEMSRVEMQLAKFAVDVFLLADAMHHPAAKTIH